MVAAGVVLLDHISSTLEVCGCVVSRRLLVCSGAEESKDESSHDVDVVMMILSI